MFFAPKPKQSARKREQERNRKFNLNRRKVATYRNANILVIGSPTNICKAELLKSMFASSSLNFVGAFLCLLSRCCHPLSVRGLACQIHACGSSFVSIIQTEQGLTGTRAAVAQG